MYGPLWRLLPGPWQVRALLCLVLFAGVVAVCFLWLFPAVAIYMPFNGNAVQTALRLPASATFERFAT